MGKPNLLNRNSIKTIFGLFAIILTSLCLIAVATYYKDNNQPDGELSTCTSDQVNC